MKKLLLLSPSKLSRFYIRVACTLLIAIGFANTAYSQCSSYQVYNSGYTTATGFTSTFAQSTLTPATSGNVPRTGKYVMTSATTTPGNNVTTPSIATPNKFSFWMRRGTAGTISTQGFIDLQINDGTNGWQSLRNATALSNYGVLTYSANILTPATVLPTTYTEYTVTFDGTPASGYSNSNVQLRVVDNRTAAASGTMYLDDISWTSRTASENNIFVPAMAYSANSCTSNLVTGDNYTLYDVGGDWDNYQLTQDNTLIFHPTSASDKIEITFLSYDSEATNDNIRVYDGAGLVLTHSGTGNPGTVTYTGTVSNDMTIRFVSDAVGSTTAAGFKITVKCISGSTCSLPGSPNAVTAIQAAQATGSWTAAAGPPAGYDIFISTNSGATPSGASYTSVGTTKVMNGLTPNTTYYYWVRSNCGGTQSAWVGPSAGFTTLCAAIAPPYTENFNGQPTSAIPTCTSADNASWQVNTVNGYLTNTVTSTNFFTRAVTLTGGTEYRLSYDYGSALGDADIKVYYGFTNTIPTSSNITTLLNTHTGITGLNNAIVNFTPLFTGTYYVRFELTAVSASPTTTLIIDNINLIQETCGPGRTLTSSGVTASAATINWLTPAAPYSPPANGYQYFLSTSSTAPTYNVTPTGTTAAGVTFVSLAGLASSTQYYIWVRSNCGGYFSAWSTVCTFTTLAGATPLILDATTNGTTKTACDYSFFDSGGSAGAYQNNETYTVTLMPAVAGTKVKIVFSTFATENLYDGLSIYNGNSTGAPLINSGLPVGNNGTTCPAGSYYGTNSPGTIISTAVDGSLTIKFTSDFSITPAGWSAFVSCVITPTISSFTPANNNCGAGGTVVLTGTNFTAITDVSFAGTPASFVVNSPTQITATIPAGASSGLISVSNNTATGYSATSFLMQTTPPVTTGVTICAGGSGTISSSTVCNGFVNSGTSITGALTAATDPTAPRPSPPGANSTTCSFTATPRNYQAIQFQVSVSGTYTFQEASTPSIDMMGYITSGSFTPGSCATGTYIVGDDDSNGGLQPRMSATLTAGVTYTLYTTTWSTTAGTASTSYAWTITPPSGGQIMLAGNPNMEWYTASSGGSPIGSGSPFNPVGVSGSGLPNTNTPGTYTFYAACSSNSTCRTATTFVINARPTVTFTAQPGATACTYNNVTYTTQAGQTNYVWTVPGVLNTDYTIVSGGIGTGSNTVTLQWLTTGVKTVTINYTNAAGCPASSATSSTATTVSASGISTTVTPSSPTICANSAQSLTATSGSANFFTWTTTAGALFTDAACTVPYVALTNYATVYFIGTVNATVTVQGTIGGTGCAAPATATITVNKATWNGSVWSNGTGPTNTISAEFQGNFTSSVNASATSGNLSACSVIVTSGNVLFDRGTLTVQNAVNVNAGSLTFSDANYDVALYQPNNVANGVGVYSGGNTGNITFNRSSAQLFKYDYTYWSSPVYPQNLLAMSPGSPVGLFLQYNNAWQYIANPGTTTMTPAKGYAVRAPQSFNLPAQGPATVYIAPFGASGGVPNNGDISIPVLGGSGQMNLLGNPYPSALFADDFITANPGLNGALYFWTHTSQSQSPYQYQNTDYAVWTLAGGVGTHAQQSGAGSANNSSPNGYIASGQGFFVQGLSNGTANFTNSMRRAGSNNNFFRTVAPNQLEKNRYWLNILGENGAFKQALVGYIETASSGIDRLFDAEMVDAGNAVALYTNVDNKKLSIQARPLPFEISDTVPLSYKTTAATNYTISIPQADGLFTSQHVYLEDTVLNVIHDLMVSDYTFATEAGTFDTRFVLRYTDTALGTNNPVFNESSVIVYKNETGLVINTGKENMSSVNVYDISGRLIATQKQINNTTTTLTTLPTTQQVLLVKIEGESGAIVTKKVVY